MLILRIRQAECALAEGRLDESMALVGSEDVRSHRRGQELVGTLAEAFSRRGREHLQAGRLAQALADCDKAARLAGDTAEIAELRQATAQALARHDREGRARADLVARARRDIENGRLSRGQHVLNELADRAGPAESLQRELTGRRQAAESVAGRARQALDRDDLAGAIDELTGARRSQLAGGRLAALISEVTEMAATRIWSALESGRVDRAELLLDRLNDLADQSHQARELTGIVAQCRQVSWWIDRGRPGQASQVLRRLQSILPKAAWLTEAVDRCRTAAEAMDALRACPVGPVALGAAAPIDRGDEDRDDAGAVAPDRPNETGDGAVLPERFLIQADGVGSFLVLRAGHITVGPVSSSRRPDLGLVTDPAGPVGTIQRAEEDYFLRCDDPVLVNEQPVKDKLLADGDRIALAPRCQMRFFRPNAASTSAVLALSHARLPQADTRTAILLDREIVLGPGPTAHIRADQMAQPAVLHVRGDRLLCRSAGPVTANGRAIDPAGAIPLGVPVRIGSITMVVKEA